MATDQLDKLGIDKTARPTPAGRSKLPGRLLLALAVLVIVILIILMVGRRGVAVETTTVVRVYPTQSFTLLNASGYVVAQRKAAVSSKITGRVEWLGVEEGSRVTRGQVIARLENRDLEAALRQAEASLSSSKAALEQARAEQEDATLAFGRQKTLLGEGIIAQAEFDAARARYKRALAAVAGGEAGVRNAASAVRSASVSYDYSLIRAPFDAVVLTKNADVGDIITPLGAAANAKAAVFTIADMGSLQVEADVSESNLGLIRNGQPCEITLDALPDRRFRGEVHTIVPTADRSKAAVLVKVRFIDRDSRILPEMSVKVAFLQRPASQEEQKPRIAVPAVAIATSAGQTGVYRVVGERASFVPVRRGASLGDLVEVSGVNSGDRIVLKPLDKLRDGSRITLPDKK